MDEPTRTNAPSVPSAHLNLGITGHRATHPLLAVNAAAIEAVLMEVLDILEKAAATATEAQATDGTARTRLHSMLADGADQLAAREALRRGWALIAPLPVGAGLNCAINARPKTGADARAILAGEQPADADAAKRADAIRELYAKALLFELKDCDEQVEGLYLTAFAPGDMEAQSSFDALMSMRVALAARIILEQSDIVIALWDGAQTNFVGGTGHTIQAALNMGAAVVLIDPEEPQAWRILRAPEALLHCAARPSDAERTEQLTQIVRDALRPKAAKANDRDRGAGEQPGIAALDANNWRSKSNPLWHAYRRIEALFGGDKSGAAFGNLQQTYETPETIALGSGLSMIQTLQSAQGFDRAFVARVAALVLPRFAWADGISSYLSDTYRGGMMINFFLSAFAIIGGIAYLPLADSHAKWAFALFELALLSAILFITYLGRKKRWHGRWFETRRAAEYLRHAPILLALGAARAPGRWPRGAETSWPEWYARHALREVGLPHLQVTADYLRHCLRDLLDKHVLQQRNYHHAKAQRLTNVHRNLDRLSEALFQIAVASVAAFLAFQVGAWLHLMGEAELKQSSNIFTFLGVALPTLGGAIAGVRYFGDFERFAAISEVTSQKLDAVHERIKLLLSAPDAKLDYASVAELAHAADDIVVSEIENWQAVFGGKQITVPV